MAFEPIKPDWAVGQKMRETGLVEDLCEHGTGHPNAFWLEINDPDGKRYLGVHGCDGCCSGKRPNPQIDTFKEIK